MIYRLSLSLFVWDDLEWSRSKMKRGNGERGDGEFAGGFILIAIIDSDIRVLTNSIDSG